MIARIRNLLPLAVVILGMILTALAYRAGLDGSWLLDDFHNLGVFSDFTPENAPYGELIFGNHSGPLGRPVSLASFAANHAAGLFATPWLKGVNLCIHLLNGLLVFLLLRQLFRVKPVTAAATASTLAAVIAAWWLLLPLHASSVLYIVQRMTLLMATFSLAACLCYVSGRQRLRDGRRGGVTGLAAALLLFLPLSVLAKESGVTGLAWIVLVEIFFFLKLPLGRLDRGQLLLALVVLAVVLAFVMVAAFPMEARYLGRDFSLAERLLSQPRALWSYVRDIFLPDGSRMGIFHDDFAVSRSLFSPWTTLPALLGLLAALWLALRMAASAAWWPVAFGILFYLSGHLLESTILPLELYFEHRNYLPALGLLIAVPVLALNLWRGSPRLLPVIIAVYIGLLAFSTYQRAHIWADRTLLIGISAQNHPHSLRAWTDYSEALLADRQPVPALQAAALTAARNPDFAAISYLQMISIYCRLRQAPPPELLAQTAVGLQRMKGYPLSLSIGLDDILTRQKRGDCGKSDFGALVPGLLQQEQNLQARFGARRTRHWHLRLTLAEWLIELDRQSDALDILRDVWLHGDKHSIPTVGLVLAETLHGQRLQAEKQQLLRELAAVTQDAPPDFLEQMNRLRSDTDQP